LILASSCNSRNIDGGKKITVRVIFSSTIFILPLHMCTQYR
jgi:hypothetical protein